MNDPKLEPKALKEELKEEVGKIYESLKEELTKSSNGKKLWEEASELVAPLLQQWASAKATLLFNKQDAVAQEIAHAIVRATAASIDDIEDALRATMSNYLAEKAGALLQNLFVKVLLPRLL